VISLSLPVKSVSVTPGSKEVIFIMVADLPEEALLKNARNPTFKELLRGKLREEDRKG